MWIREAYVHRGDDYKRCPHYGPVVTSGKDIKTRRHSSCRRHACFSWTFLLRDDPPLTEQILNVNLVALFTRRRESMTLINTSR
jgi:hypothetical protein